MTDTIDTTDERLRRWRLILGGNEADGTGYSLDEGDAGIDKAQPYVLQLLGLAQ